MAGGEGCPDNPRWPFPVPASPGDEPFPAENHGSAGNPRTDSRLGYFLPHSSPRPAPAPRVHPGGPS